MRAAAPGDQRLSALSADPKVQDRIRSTLSGRDVLVTGGAGFIGSHVTDLLIAADARSVVILDNMIRGRIENLSSVLPSNRVRVIDGDIRDTPLLRDLVGASEIVFHMAALRITHCASEPRHAMEVMIDSTFEVVEACRQAQVKKVVMSSSASVYGMAESFPTPESNHPYDNRTFYGMAKTFGEGLLRSYNDMYGLDYVCLRYFNVYGPRMDIFGKYTEVLIRWMERIDAGEPPIIFGDGSQTMDMLHVRDVARANILAAASPACDVALNVGSGTETSLLGLALHLTRVMGKPHLQPIFREERAINPVRRRLADTSAARNLIDFQTSVDLDRGLAELVEWWRVERVNIPKATVDA